MSRMCERLHPTLWTADTHNAHRLPLAKGWVWSLSTQRSQLRCSCGLLLKVPRSDQTEYYHLTARVEALKLIFSQHWIPETVVSDNGPQYTSQEFVNFARSYPMTSVMWHVASCFLKSMDMQKGLLKRWKNCLRYQEIHTWHYWPTGPLPFLGASSHQQSSSLEGSSEATSPKWQRS